MVTEWFMMDLSAYKGIIFDMDGTLIDSIPGHFSAWAHACELIGVPFDAAWLFSLSGSPSIHIAQAIIDKYRVSVDATTLANIKLRYFDLNSANIGVISSTVDVLKSQQGKMKIAIATGSKKKCADALLFQNGLLPLIDTLVTANQVSNHKPHPETFLLAAHRLGLAPHECVVFEDAEFGFQAARASGMDYFPVADGKIQPLVIVR